PVSTNTARVGGPPEPRGGQVEDLRLWLGHADLGGDHDVVEEMVPAQLLLEARPQREIGVAQHRAAVGGTQGADYADVGVDGHLRAAPLVVQPRQRAASAALELAVRAVGPRRRIADAALDVGPGRAAVERLEDRGSAPGAGPDELP